MALNLTGKISLDGSGFESGLKRVMGAVTSVKGLVASAFGTFAIANIVRSTVEWAGSLRDAADNLGINVEFLQKMQNGAKMVGADLEEVSRLINEINKSRQEAFREPGGKAAQAFGRLGFTGADITGLSTQAFVEKLIAAFKSGASTQAIMDLQEVGGKSARVLTAAFLAQFQSDAPILSEEIINQLDVIGDKFTNLSTIMRVQMAPAIVALGEAFGVFMRRVGESAGFWSKFADKFTEERAKMLASPERPRTMISGVPALLGIISKAWSAAGAEADRMTVEMDAALEKMEKALKAGQDARKAAENAPPGFEEPADRRAAAFAPLGKIKAPDRAEAGDALVRVGNFLGSTPSTINGIQQQIQIQRSMDASLKRIESAVAMAVSQMRLAQTAFPMF